ncbi:MAG: hypothetical protein IPK53_19515 [bacterium]|nr:hypothetical protein [bacterium]
MARLNRLVVEALLAAGVPAIQAETPSALALCENSRITITPPPSQALATRLVPVAILAM